MTRQQKPPRHAIIADHLRQKGSISPLEALGLYSMPQLPAVIKILRDTYEWNIRTDMKRAPTSALYARYVLVKEGKQV